jgi:hypothetical protein
MKSLVLLSCAAATQAFLLPIRKMPLCSPRAAAMRMEDNECIVNAENALEQQACLEDTSAIDECISDAENAAEIEACKADATMPPTAASKSAPPSVPIDECISDAENAAEIEACMGDATSTSSESAPPGVPIDECISDAENAAEIEACTAD